MRLKKLLHSKTGILFFLFFSTVNIAYAENLYIETESATLLTAPMQITSDTNASEGKFAYIPNGNGVSLSVPGKGISSYTVNIPTNGTYVIWGRIIAIYPDDDSFFVQVDNGTNYTWMTPAGNTWHWAKVKDYFQGNITFNLTAGTHTIKIKQREDGTKIDKLFLTNDLTQVPTDVKNTPPPAVCGNKILESPEACDDGNLVSGDGCTSACVKEFCGDTIVQTGLGEQCEGTTTASCTTSNGYLGTKTCQAATCLLNTCTSKESCGDGIRNGSEFCDEGLTNGLPNHCNAQCTGITIPVCGNGTLESPEACDDGNLVSGDGCTSTCVKEFCGDTIVQTGLGEQCEGTTTASCTTYNGYLGTKTCQAATCAFNTCTSTESCGDGIKNGLEFCDEGTINGLPNHCNTQCTGIAPSLNNLYIETEATTSLTTPMQIASDTNASGGGFTYIPNGNGNSLSVPGKGTSSYTVNIPVNGTYVIWGRIIAVYPDDDSFFVQVDNGTNYTWMTPSGNTWHWAKVKDYFQGNITFNLTAGTHTINIKQREDGVKIDKLFLTSDLTQIPADVKDTPPPAVCGNKTLESPEACDDGNLISGDGCTNTCTKEFCGDGIKNNTEVCDEGTSNGLLNHCNAQCAGMTTLGCGNGILEVPEACDDANLISGDGCSNTCVKEFCGDGIIQSGLGEVCDQKNISLISCTASNGYTGTQSCQTNCTLGTCITTEYCGDGIVQTNEECDDNNIIPVDGCSSKCAIELQSTSLDKTGMDRVKALTIKLNNMAIISTHPRIFLNQEKLADLRAKSGQTAWNTILAAADKGDLVSSALGYLMLEQSNPSQALIYATNVYNKINGTTFTNWCTTGVFDLKPRIDVAMASLAFDWAYNGLTPDQRTIIINKLGVAADIAAKKLEIDNGIAPSTNTTACQKRSTKGETFHREEWEFYAYEAWPEIALAGHHPDAEAIYKARWDYQWYWGDAARMEAYINDGTPFEGYYFGNDGVSWFLPLESATGINLIDGPELTWNTDAAYYMLYRLDVSRSHETMHKGVATSTSAVNSFLKTTSDTWKLREHIFRTFALTAPKDPYLQWIINNKVDRVSSWLMTNNYFGSITELSPVTKLLFYNETAPQKDPTTATYEELPFDRHFAGGNEAYMRTGWGPKATIVGFRSKPVFTMTSHSDFDVNTFVIHRDGGPLAPDSGVYDAYEQQGNYFKYQKNTIAHNDLLIIDPADPDAPKKLSLSADPGGTDLRSTKTFSAPSTSSGSVFVEKDPTANWADITRFETQPGYAYLVGDGREAYGSRLSKYDRNLAFLRKGNDEGYLIIFDRVAATSATYKKKWLLHTVGEPMINGKIIDTQVPSHIETYDGNYINTTNFEGTSKLHAKVLLPLNHSIRRVSGEILHINGTVTVNYASDKVAGNGTAFTPVMVGHYFHVNKDKTSTVPTGYDGYFDWYQIKSVEDATHLTLNRTYTKTSLDEPYIINQGYQFWVDGITPKNMFVTGATKANCDNALIGKAWQHMGQGRVELMPPDGNRIDYFLVAMYIGDVNSVLPANTIMIENKTGDPMKGVLIDNKVVMFGQTGGIITQTSFNVTQDKSVDFLIADLNPEQIYIVRKEGINLLSKTASNEGTISFSDTPGPTGSTYSLSQ